MAEHFDIGREKFVIGLFAAAGVAAILYQHAQHTGQLLQAVGAMGSAFRATPQPGTTGGDNMIYPGSLAGTPSPGQENMQAENPPLNNLNIGRNWEFR